MHALNKQKLWVALIQPVCETIQPLVCHGTEAEKSMPFRLLPRCMAKLHGVRSPSVTKCATLPEVQTFIDFHKFAKSIL